MNYATITQRPTKGGNVFVLIRNINAPDRTRNMSKGFYRTQELPESWSTTKHGARILGQFQTSYIGQQLVSDFRKAMDDGLITKDQVRAIRDSANAQHGGNGTYDDREWQNTAAHALYDHTGRLEHAMTDAWLYIA